MLLSDIPLPLRPTENDLLGATSSLVMELSGEVQVMSLNPESVVVESRRGDLERGNVCECELMTGLPSMEGIELLAVSLFSSISMTGPSNRSNDTSSSIVGAALTGLSTLCILLRGVLGLSLTIRCLFWDWYNSTLLIPEVRLSSLSLSWLLSVFRPS